MGILQQPLTLLHLCTMSLSQFGGRDVGRIPVVDRNEPTKLLGVLRRHDIIRAYSKAVGESERTSQSI